MSYKNRDIGNPYWTGYILQEKVKCGKENCRCMNGGKKHTAFYLYWRDYHPEFAWRTRNFNEAGEYKIHEGPKLRKKHISKKDVAKVQRQLALCKGVCTTWKMTYKQIEEFYYAYPGIKGEDYLIQSYLHFANPNAEQWMNYNPQNCM